MDVTALPALNATLNGISAVLLTTGYVFIRRKQIRSHRLFMLSSLGTSALFLVSYLAYHAMTGSKHFPGEGTIRLVYFAILISHTLLAALVPILAITAAVLALRNRIARHRRIARWTLPIWLYVSVTGVVIYVMLYRLY
jgi:putative membrane protein